MAKFIALLVFILLIRLVTFTYFQPKDLIIQPQKESPAVFANIKNHIHATYVKVLPKEQADLLMGIVFGTKDLSSSSKEKFVATGVMHVVAASGMNVSMLISFLLGTLAVFINRRYALIVTAIILIFYTALADFQPSIVRAAIMGLMALGASFLGRQNASFLALFLAAWGMIFFDPAIITSISFMLSFSATLGIIVLDPILKQIAFKSSLFEDFRTTLSAQIATTPILLFFFGTYSATSIVVNLLILWTIPPLMVLGTIAAFISFISQILSYPFIYLSLPLLSYFDLVIDFFARLAGPIEIEKIPLLIVVGYYLILAALVIRMKRGGKRFSRSK